jgi:hypothetical protein
MRPILPFIFWAIRAGKRVIEAIKESDLPCPGSR